MKFGSRFGRRKGASKYGARKVKADGFTFDSQAEYRRYQELLLLKKAGKISDIKVHTRLPIIVHNIKATRCVRSTQICQIEADFDYLEEGKTERTFEDVKGVVTAVSRLKHKLLLALYPGIDWRIVKAR